MKVVNLTPHPIHILDKDGTQLLTIPPGGNAVRVDMVKKPADSITVGGRNIPVHNVSYGNVQGLPDPNPDTVYIVSSVVAQAVARDDVLVPGDLVRDSDGNVVGCLGLNRTI